MCVCVCVCVCVCRGVVHRDLHTSGSGPTFVQPFFPSGTLEKKMMSLTPLCSGPEISTFSSFQHGVEAWRGGWNRSNSALRIRGRVVGRQGPFPTSVRSWRGLS